MIAPPRLRRGDRIGVVAPSGPVEQRHVLAGARALAREGFRVVLAPHVFDRRGHLAGTDAARAADLNRMLRDPDIRCVLMARGGYGTMRIADQVDWGAMRRDPKIYAGFSDATFLHLGFASQARVRTLHGPNLQGLKGVALKRWIEWVTNPRPSERVRTLSGRFHLGTKRGKARGIVLGGNLKLVDYAVGTGLLPTLRGAILFLEEVNEPPYKLDGMFRQLILAGSLRGLRGVALGDFLKCAPRPGRRELPARQVLEDHMGPLGVPCVGGFPAGHA
ncbi:MAG: S66 peptidase family protein, partial [Candidatus Eiseniibacteriota bacterium]